MKTKVPSAHSACLIICIAMMDAVSVDVCVCVNVILCVFDTLACWPEETPAELFIFAICFSINLLIWRLQEPNSKLCVSPAPPNNDK